MNYWPYIESDKWRNSPVRLAELAEANNRCRICFRPGSKASPIEAHHATYIHLGCEERGELLAICRDCHEEVTSFFVGASTNGDVPAVPTSLRFATRAFPSSIRPGNKRS